MRTYVILILVSVAIYIAYTKKKQLEKLLGAYGILDYFNYSRAWSPEEAKKIHEKGNQIYRSERDRLVAQGIWKFPSMFCANILSKKYNLSEFQRDGLAVYPTFEKIAERLAMMTNQKVKLSSQEISNLCGGKL